MLQWLSARNAQWRPYPSLLAGLMLLTAACSQPPAQPTTPTSPPAEPTTTVVSTANPAAAAASGPAVSPSVPSTLAAASSAASPSSVTAPTSVGSGRFTIVPAESEARYVAREQLAANTIQSDATGSTKDVSGQIIVGPSGQIATGSRIIVGLQNLASDRSQRDNYIKRNTLQTDQFATVEFTPTEVQGLAWPVPMSGEATFMLVGDMVVHGVTKPATWDVAGTFTAQDVTGKASTVVRLDTFGMRKPQVPVVASIEDDIRLELDFAATRSS